MYSASEKSPDELLAEAREYAIKMAARAMEWHLAEFYRTGCFSERGAADAARLRMEKLIKERRPEFVARLELERGLV